MKRLPSLRTLLAQRAPERIEESGTIEASVALLLAEGAGGLELLLIRRAQRSDDPWSGHIALPGGRRDPGDKDRLATVLRETREETGVVLDPAWLLGELDDVHPKTPVLPSVAIRPFVFALPERAHASCSDEVAECLWTPLEDLRKSESRATVLFRGLPIDVPAFVLGDHVVWGLTHRILTQFFSLLP